MKPLCNIDIVLHHARLAPQGPSIECGVYDGVTSLAIHAARLHEQHYAADTFSGMPYDGNELEIRGGFTEGYLCPMDKETTLRRLIAHGIMPLVGKVEDTLLHMSDVKWAFILFDLDLEAPTRMAVEALLPQVVVGGRVGFHDYVVRDTEYSLEGIAHVVSDLLISNPNWTDVTQDQPRFIFFKRIK